MASIAHGYRYNQIFAFVLFEYSAKTAFPLGYLISLLDYGHFGYPGPHVFNSCALKMALGCF